MLNPGERIFCEWEQGGYLNSLGGPEEFVSDLADMVRQFGTPSKVEIRQEHEGWIHASQDEAGDNGNRGSSDHASCEDPARQE